ncbi:type II secretion system GspH family protein [Patescibacteria group bacterium]|nr:type II secretion system GspH family protein [Patescibacteria group bacterium]
MDIMNRKHGFTLVELLITVSIIAILASIGISVYSSLQKNARDGKRQADLRSIQSALEQYYSDQGFYPAETPNPFIPGNPLDGCTGNSDTVSCSSEKVYLNTIPDDPDSSKNYYYAPAGVAPAISYELCAALEIAPSTVQTCTELCGVACNFKVTPP